MKKILNAIPLDLILLAAIFTTISLLFVVPKINKLSYEIINISNTTSGEYIFYHDFNKNGTSEKIIYSITEGNYFIEYQSDAFALRLPFNSMALQKPYFGDINNDNIDEIVLIMQKNDSIFISAIKIDKTKISFLVKNKFVCTINKNIKEGFDVRTSVHNFFFDYNHDSYNEFIFSITAEYSFQPRSFYNFDFENDTIIKSPQSGAYFDSQDTLDFNKDGMPEIYFSSLTTINITEDFYGINYPDTSSWFMLLDKNLNFCFKPIEIPEKGSYISVQPLVTKDTTFLAVFKINRFNLQDNTLSLYTHKGKLLRSKKFSAKKFQKLNSMANSSPDYKSIYLFRLWTKINA